MSDGAAVERLAALLGAVRSDGQLVLLTGAGVSAESGIPTFRGKDGYWTIGSTNHTPMQMATHAMFERAPEEVWAWYLMRFAACRAAEPNAAHEAIVRIEQALGERATLITQNIDGLHQRAGSSEQRTFAIHGDARKMRCASGRHDELLDLPELAAERAPLSAATRAALTCARCGGWLRPHVLWFDEYYTEELFRAESALARAAAASLLIVAGTMGATTLPYQIGLGCARRGVPIIDVNIEDNPFGELARSSGGVALREPASVALPRIATLLTG
ncbi:MAG: Sir2 family NAD-dependent protein deacetylase [Polyangiaceae bacterium]